MGLYAYNEKKIKYYEWLLDYIAQNHKKILIEAIKKYINKKEKEEVK